MVDRLKMVYINGNIKSRQFGLAVFLDRWCFGIETFIRLALSHLNVVMEMRT